MRVLRFLTPLLFLIGFAIPAAGVAAGAAHAAAAPSITLDPNAVQFDVATTVTATGAGFTPQSGVQIRIDKQPAIGGATAGAGGAFSSKLTVPVLTLGRHAISATDSIGLTASQPLYAVNVTLSTKTPRQSESIVISGAGFYPSRQLVIYLANQAVRTLTTDASGSFQNQSIVVPASAAGQVTLRLVSGANPAIEYDTILTIPVQAATLSISPTSTVSGGLVAVTGSGFTAGERVDVTLNNAAAGTATATVAGQMSLAFSVPRTLAPGTYTLMATGEQSHASASATLTILGPSAALSRTSGPAGTMATLTGQSFAANDAVTITANGATLATAQTDAHGSFSATFAIPAGPAGAITLSATGQANHATATATFTRTASTLVASAGSVQAGGKLTLRGGGFTAREPVALTIPGTTLATVLADAGGIFVVEVTVPPNQAPGSLTITATGQTSHVAASTVVAVTAAAHISLSAPMAPVGSAVIVSGTGFGANEPIVLTIPGSTLGTTTTNAQGTFTFTARAPTTNSSITVTITATGQISHRAASAALAITPVAVHITLGSTPAYAGASVLVSGTGFLAGEHVTITVPGHILVTITADTLGAFSNASIAVPAGTGPGALTLTVTGQTSHRVGTVAVQVVARPTGILTLSSSSGVAGTRITLSGTEFSAGERIAISFDRTTVATAIAAANGTFSTTLAVPDTLIGGAHAVSATGAASKRSLSATFTARPAVTLSASALNAGGQVSIRGTGFAPREQVSLSIDGAAAFASAVTDAYGRFAATASMPAGLAPGTIQIKATGLSSHLAAVTAAQYAIPSNGKVGSTTWYFAAGRTDGGFATQLAILNPNAQAVQGTMTFFYGANQVKTSHFSLQAHARGTYDVGRLIGASTRISTMVQASLPIAAARTTQRGAEAVMSTTGVSTPSRSWYMAEGYTGLTFQEDLSLLNPGSRPARVTVTWPLFNGKAPVHYDVTLAPRSRLTIPVNDHVDRASHATVISADQPIVAARTILFGARHQGAGSKAGSTAASSTMYFAEGSTNNGFEEYLTILNPSSSRQATVQAQFYDRQGRLLGTRTIVVDPMHRGNLKVNDVTRNTAIAAVLHSDVAVVAERAMYFGAPNGGSAGGTVVFGKSTTARGWAFAAGDTRYGHSEFELLFNPGSTPSTVLATYYADNGQVVQKTFTLNGNSRLNIDVTKDVPGLGRGYHGVILRSTNGVPFVAEQALYGNNMGNGSAMLGTPIS